MDRELYETDANVFINYYENPDGSVFATIPLSWVKISKPRQMTEEQKTGCVR